MNGLWKNIIHMIRNQSSIDEAYLIDWLMKKLKITDLQAKFVLHTEIGRLSKGHLNKYKEEQLKEQNLSDLYIIEEYFNTLKNDLKESTPNGGKYVVYEDFVKLMLNKS